MNGGWIDTGLLIVAVTLLWHLDRRLVKLEGILSLFVREDFAKRFIEAETKLHSLAKRISAIETGGTERRQG